MEVKQAPEPALDSMNAQLVVLGFEEFSRA